jgi:hypothetical protein
MHYVRPLWSVVPMTGGLVILALAIAGLLYLLGVSESFGDALRPSFRLSAAFGFLAAVITTIVGNRAAPKLGLERRAGEMTVSPAAALVVASLVIGLVGELVL